MADDCGAVFIGPADEDWLAGDWVPVGTCGLLITQRGSTFVDPAQTRLQLVASD